MNKEKAETRRTRKKESDVPSAVQREVPKHPFDLAQVTYARTVSVLAVQAGAPLQ